MGTGGRELGVTGLHTAGRALRKAVVARASGVVRRSVALAALCAVTAFAFVATVQGTIHTSAATLSIAVQGNHFVNGSGQTIRLLGVNRSGSEYMCASAGGNTFDGPADDASVAAIAAWHTNAVRVPLNEDCWLGINGLPMGQTAASYQQAIIAYVNLLHAHGLYAILDLHWNNSGTNASTGQEGMADTDHAPALWTSVATAFKSDPAVVFDLYNEPHDITWTCWRDGGCTDPVGGFVDAGMQSLVNAVRNTGATQPIMAGGLAYANDLSQWQAFKPTDPGNALVASIHNYNFNACSTASCWGSTYQPITTTNPVVTGELGEDDCAHGYIDGYMSWADQNGVSYLGWAWNTYGCGTFPSLISDFTGTPTAFGAGFQAHLTALAGTPSPSPSPSPSPTPGPSCPSSSAVPCYDHVVTIMMENTKYSDIIGNSAAPYINSLLPAGALAANYFAVDHPSLPNYMSFSAGQEFASWSSSDCDAGPGCQTNAANIADRVEGTGRTWKEYAESMGSPCQLSSSGPYYARHNPFVYFTQITGNATRCNSHVVDFSNMAGDFGSASTTPNYVFITPNGCNDMHDCSTQTGDTWLSQNVPTILSSPAFTTQKSLLIITWDEDDSSGNNQVAFIAVGSGVKTNYSSPVAYNHYSYLKTIEASWGLTNLTTNDGSASPMSDLFGSAGPPPLTAAAGGSPTAGQAPLTVAFTGSAAGGTAPYSYSWNFGDGSAASTSQNPSHAYSAAGTYTARLTVTDSAAHTATANAPTVTVATSPPPLSVTATALPTAGDAPAAVAFTGTASGGTSPYTYTWTFGDGTSGAGATPTHTYTGAGTYTATVTVTDANATKSSATVTVVVSPTLALSAGASPLVVDVGDSVNFTSTASGGLAPYTYSWNFGDGSPASNNANPTHAYSSAAMFTASLTVTDTNGVKATMNVLVTVHALPTVSAAATPNAADAPATASLSATPNGGITPYSFSWNFGDGSLASTTQNPSHVYSTAGSYTATVTVTDAAGHSSTGSAGVSVSPALSASAGATPTSGPAPLSVSLTASPNGGRTPYTYSWNFGDGTAASTAQNPSHVYANAGPYQATVTVTDANGVHVSASAPQITVTPTVLVVTAGATPIAGDAPLAVTFNAAATGGTAPVGYSWTFGDGTSGTGAAPSHTYTAAGSYVATVTAKDAGTQTATAQVTITVSPALTLSIAASSQSVDSGDAVNFASTPGGGLPPYSYSWTFGDGATSAAQNPSHTYTTAAHDTASLTITDANGATKTAAVQVTVNPLPAITAAANPTAGDAPLTVGLTSSPSGGTLPYSFSWDFGDGTAASISQNPTHDYTAAGAYTARVTLTDAAGHTATGSAAVTVSPALTATAGASPTSGQAPLNVNLTAAPAGGKSPYTFSWNFGDGSSASTTQNPAHTYASAGTYSATVTVTDANGVKITATAPAVTVTVAPLVITASVTPVAGDAPVTASFKATASGGTAPLSYAWTFGDGTTGSGVAPSHTYNAAGSYTATVQITDGASQTASSQVTVVVSPSLSAGAVAIPQVVDTGDTVSFTVTPAGGLAPFTYTWSFGDGSPAATTQNPGHAYSSAAMYTSTVSVTDANGVKTSTTVLVTVHALPTVAAAASPAAGDAPVAVSLSATPGGGTTPYTYSWNFGDGSAPSTTQSPSHSYTTAGNFDATITLTDAAGHTATASSPVAISPALGASATASPTSGQAPVTVSLSATPTGGRTPYTYSWNFGDGTTPATTQNPTHSYALPGTFTARVTITDANGMSASASAPAVDVTPAPLVASAAASPSIGDAPLPTTLTANATGGTAPFTYAWNLGDGSSSSQQSFSHTYGAGSYTVTLTITDSAAKTSSATVHVTVYPSLSVSTSASPTSGTAPLPVTFAATVTGGLAPYSYTWSYGDGSTGSGASVSNSYGPGTFSPTLTVHDAAGGMWTGTVATISASAPPPPPSSGDGSSSGSGNAGAPAPSTATPSAPASASPTTAAPSSPTASPGQASSNPGSGGGGNSFPLLIALFGSILTTGVGAAVFVGWRRWRLR